MNVAIIGAGLTGSSAARVLADAGHKVTIFEKEFGQFGGSCADLHVGDDVYMAQYGPHIFHTNDEAIWKFVNRFSRMRNIVHTVSSLTDKGLLPWPINNTSIRGTFKKDTIEEATSEWLQDMELTKQILDSGDGEVNFETEAMRKIGGELYRTFIKGYTECQWQCKASELPAELFKRIRIVSSESRSFFNDKYVAMPVYGYSNLARSMLDHPNISIEYRKITHEDLLMLVYGYHMVINTAPTNDLIEDATELPFNRVKFHYNVGVDLKQHGCPVLNINKATKYTRITDYSALYGKGFNKRLTGSEEPHKDGVPLYVIGTKANLAESERQKAILMRMSVISTGRMGGYKYVNMDEAIALGFEAASKVIGGVKWA